jgi:predicted nucleotidyltransferase
MKGLEPFEKCFSRVKHVDFDGYRLSIIGFADLMKNKEAVGREIDRSDIIELKKIRKSKGKDPL